MPTTSATGTSSASSTTGPRRRRRANTFGGYSATGDAHGQDGHVVLARLTRRELVHEAPREGRGREVGRVLGRRAQAVHPQREILPAPLDEPVRVEDQRVAGLEALLGHRGLVRRVAEDGGAAAGEELGWAA